MGSNGAMLDDTALRRYGVARNFPPQDDEEQDVVTTTLSFHQQGEVCVAARNDGVISVINCLSGMWDHEDDPDEAVWRGPRPVYAPPGLHPVLLHERCERPCVNYHEDIPPYAESNGHYAAVSCADRIRYHSLFDNKFLRYYAGHSARVTSLMMHPTADEFMSCSLDGTARLWDLRDPDTRALIRVDHQPATSVCGAYDQEGVVFGVYTDDHLIRMYDARNYQDGPFAKFSLYDSSILSVLDPHLARRQAPNLNVKKLHALDIKFSPDGNQLLVTTNRSVFLHLDAFEGHLLHVFTNHEAAATTANQPRGGSTRLGSAYSADGAYVTTGSEDGRLFVYRASNGEHVHTLPRGHQGPVLDLQWNPQRHLLGSVGGNSTVFWTAGNM
ncbi:histone H3 methyltransferase, partial [Globisporangium splendens]